ncbi:MAG: hypothetical protein CME19_06860 [Gemmatimonadetes bacterium]|nr:hypothetical protein [Gemmatimonadota bacterium]
MYPNPLKTKLKNGETVLGTSLPAPTAVAASMVLGTGPDFLWIDLEHQPFDTESIGSIPIFARQQGVAPMIRVAWNDPARIKKAYDAGAVAVMVPQVEDADQARFAVQCAKYPPEGNRGLSPNWAVVAGLDRDHVMRTANEETVLVVQIESQEAFNNLDEIVKVPGIDVLFFGPLDMTASVGKITDTGCEEVQSLMRAFPERLDGTGIVPATTLVDPDEIEEKLDWGYRFMNVGNALAYGCQVLKGSLERLRSR